MLPTVDFCGLSFTRLLLGANPFGGFSHQNKARNEEMVAYSTPARIKETWERAHAAGINTMVTNNETPHVINTTAEYLAEGGPLQWVAQVAYRSYGTVEAALDRAVEIGACAAYLHGGITDQCYAEQDEAFMRRAIRYGQSLGIPMGVAGHSPEAHRWVNSLELVDFHTVCFFNCGSLHYGKGDKFYLGDVFRAVDVINEIEKPCIAYKIMGAGRIEAAMAFEYAFESIKPGDVVNVGMHRGDNDNMVEENVALVAKTLEKLAAAAG